MMHVRIPNICYEQQTYILNLLLCKFFGLDFEVESYQGDIIEITKAGSLDKLSKLTLSAFFFCKVNPDWLKPNSLPTLPLANWFPSREGIKANLTGPTIPVLYGAPGLVKRDNHIHINLDIFGSVFFMLTRYEELVVKERDQHDRFPAHLSYAYKNGY